MRALVQLAAFAVALTARVSVGAPRVSDSAVAGLLFAACLLLLAAVGGEALPSSWLGCAAGVAGGAVLCLPIVARGGFGEHRPAGSLLGWAAVVSVVALAEEVFLRGTLFATVASATSGSTWWPIMITAVAFAVLHVPLYGWGALPLDLAVGVWLGVLRSLTGTVSAPAAAHVVADLAGWWLR